MKYIYPFMFLIAYGLVFDHLYEYGGLTDVQLEVLWFVCDNLFKTWMGFVFIELISKLVKHKLYYISRRTFHAIRILIYSMCVLFFWRMFLNLFGLQYSDYAEFRSFVNNYDKDAVGWSLVFVGIVLGLKVNSEKWPNSKKWRKTSL